MSTDPATSAAVGGRRLGASALITLLVAIALALVPGTAAAAGGGPVKPFANCTAQNSDGSYTVVIGYVNSSRNTFTIAHGKQNYSAPASYTGQLPTTFAPGTNNGAATVRLSAADMRGSTFWYLSGHRLDYSSAGSLPTCTQAQLPQLANGAALVGVLAIAGLIGALVVRRIRNRAVGLHA